MNYIMKCEVCKKRFKTKGTNVRHCGMPMVLSEMAVEDKKLKETELHVWECVVCKERIVSSNKALSHCGTLTQWVKKNESFEEWKKNKKVKILVKGHIEMSQENYDKIMGYEDPFKGLILSINTFANTDNLEFEIM